LYRIEESASEIFKEVPLLSGKSFSEIIKTMLLDPSRVEACGPQAGKLNLWSVAKSLP
jgi:hypothetical protein